MRNIPKFPIVNDNDLNLFWKIASLEVRSRKMWSNRHYKSFSWSDWYSLEDDIADLYTQTKSTQDMIKRVVQRLET
jgi:hypothetical protein